MKRFVLTLQTCVLVVFGAASVLRAQTSGQLYLVTGVQLTQDQTLKVPSAVYSVDASKRVATPIAELVGPKDGSIFVQADHDRRVIVIGSWHVDPPRLIVLSMDAPSKPRSNAASYQGWFEFFLFENPQGRLIEAFHVGPCCTQDRLFGFDLLAPDPSGDPQDLPFEGYRNVRREGAWPPGDDTRVQVFPRATLLLDSNKGIADLGVSLPASIKPERDDFFSLAVSNDEMLVINRARFPGKERIGEGGTTELLVYEKKFQRWSTVPFPGAVSAVRGFGHWLAVGHRDLMVSLEAFLRNDMKNARESPGSDHRQTSLRSGSDARDGGDARVDNFFGRGRYYYPGVLYLYNVRTQMRYQIKTGEGDSEVLLVDGDTVYYRVNQTLYRATLGTSKLENPTQILSDEIVQLSHWAFIGPAPSQ